MVKKGFDSETVYNEKFLKAKINSYDVKINVGSHNNRVVKS